VRRKKLARFGRDDDFMVSRRCTVEMAPDETTAVATTDSDSPTGRGKCNSESGAAVI
jgi:hypothetical protein